MQNNYESKTCSEKHFCKCMLIMETLVKNMKRTQSQHKNNKTMPIAIYWWFLYQLQISSHIIYQYLHYWLRTKKSRLDLLDHFLCQLNSFKGIDLSQLLNDAFSFLTDKASAIWPLHVLLQYPFPIHYYKIISVNR